MRRKNWLLVIVVVLGVMALLANACSAPSAPSTPGGGTTPTPTGAATEYITYKGEETGTEYKWAKGEKIDGMKPGEENQYIEWKWSTSSAIVKEVTEMYWVAEEVMKRTKGHFKIKIVPGGALASAMEGPFILGSGAFQMLYSWANYFPAEMPMQNLQNTPFFVPMGYDAAKPGDVSIVKRAYDLGAYINQHPIAQQDLAKLNLYTIHGVNAGTTYYLLIRKGTGIKTLEDMKGHPMRATAYHAVVAKAMGIIPLNMEMSAPQLEAMSKGIIDIGEHSETGIRTVGFWEYIERVIAWPRGFGAGSSSVYVNLEAYKQLPDYMKKIYEDMKPDLREYYTTKNARYLAECVNWWNKEKGIPLVYMPKEEEDKWRAAGTLAFQAYSDFVTNNLKLGPQFRQFMRDAIAKRNQLTPEDPWTMWNPPAG